MKAEKFYVTTPIYYVNDRPHIGHAYTTVLADVLARHHRLMGVPTFFLTGTDEHGQKVQRAAAKSGVPPQRHADDTVVRFIDLWKKLEITNDDFIRTTEERHKTVVRDILRKLYEAGEIYKAEYDGWYCVTCERFFTGKDLAEGKCPEPGCGRPVDKIKESNYFFRMSKYQDWLIQYINDNPGFIRPDFRRNETLGFLRKKLNDLCISRPKSRLAWGIELPFDSDFVTYVWFDALVNYLSAVGYLSDRKRFDKWWPASCQLIGKDILTTHTVYWPIMLKAMGISMPETIFAHGWWLAGESKMSKSAGNVVEPMDFVERYGADSFRYFLLSEMIPGQDASFTEEAFIRRYNSDLANDLGNLLSRVVKMVSSYCGGVIPRPGAEGDAERELRGAALAGSVAMAEAVKTLRLDTGIAAAIGAVREANRYLEKRRPWDLAAQNDSESLGTVLYFAAETLRIVSSLLYPVMPGKMAELRRALGLPAGEPDFGSAKEWGRLKPGTRIESKKSLFPRVVTESAAGLPRAGVGTDNAEGVTGTKPLTFSAGAPQAGRSAEVRGKQETAEGVMQIEYADFQKVELRTARVVEAEKVEKTDKLLRLQIEIGGEKRQIVAGIAQHYKPEELIGKTVVAVANLKPAIIRGVESNGMALAAVSGDGTALRLVTVDGDMPSGAVVK